MQLPQYMRTMVFFRDLQVQLKCHLLSDDEKDVEIEVRNVPDVSSDTDSREEHIENLGNDEVFVNISDGSGEESYDESLRDIAK